ncbi:MAG: rhodanese-like domain-containing protein [Planctomycetes bacterium]|nr:rhodanese-like domain-containing protein [Planctomycetota bacterium]
MFEKIDVHKAKEMIENEKDLIVVDVRRDDEYYGPLGHIKGSIHIPIEQFTERVKELDGYKGKKILAVCFSGRRSAKACDILALNNFTNLYNVTGGMMEWEEFNFEREITVKP